MGILNADTGNLVYIVPQSSYYYTVSSEDQNVEETEEDIILNDIDKTIQEQQDARLILSATEHYSKTEAAVTTNYPVSSSGSQGDHYRPKGPVIKFRGVISESSINLLQGVQQVFTVGETNEAVVETYIAKIRETLRMLKDDSGDQAFPLVNIHLPDNNTENNCLITNFKISRDKKLGNGYSVDITAQKLLIADSTFSVVPATDAHQPNVTTNAGTTERTESNQVGITLTDGG